MIQFTNAGRGRLDQRSTLGFVEQLFVSAGADKQWLVFSFGFLLFKGFDLSTQALKG